MYQIGDHVVYGIHGVCNIVDLETRTLDRKKITYLVLEPVGQDGSRYLVPAHNEVAMAKLRTMLTSEELAFLMDSEEIRRDVWVRDENQRKNKYRELIASGDRVALMQMVHTLYVHRKSQQDAGKKVHQADENFLRDAEKLLAGEISIVMNIPADQAKIFLRNHLKEE